MVIFWGLGLQHRNWGNLEQRGSLKNAFWKQAFHTSEGAFQVVNSLSTSRGDRFIVLWEGHSQLWQDLLELSAQVTAHSWVQASSPTLGALCISGQLVPGCLPCSQLHAPSPTRGWCRELSSHLISSGLAYLVFCCHPPEKMWASWNQDLSRGRGKGRKIKRKAGSAILFFFF